jgi:hypothetical protein
MGTDHFKIEEWEEWEKDDKEFLTWGIYRVFVVRIS